MTGQSSSPEGRKHFLDPDVSATWVQMEVFSEPNTVSFHKGWRVPSKNIHNIDPIELKKLNQGNMKAGVQDRRPGSKKDNLPSLLAELNALPLFSRSMVSRFHWGRRSLNFTL